MLFDPAELVMRISSGELGIGKKQLKKPVRCPARASQEQVGSALGSSYDERRMGEHPTRQQAR